MNRPLFSCCVTYILTLALCIFLPKVVFLSAAAILAAAVFVVFIIKKYKIYTFYLLSLLLVSVITFTNFTIFQEKTVKPIKSLSNTETKITATVLQTEYSERGNEYYTVKLNTINGKKAPYAAKIRLFTLNNEPLCDYDKISVSISFFEENLSSNEKLLASNSILASAMASSDIKVINSKDFSLFREICKIRDKMIFNIRSAISGEEGNIISGLLFGKRDFIERETSDLFAVSGISHLLAVSGLHLSIIVFLIDWLLLFMFIDKPYRSAIIILLSLIMVVMTGFTPSIIRATVMTTLVLISQIARLDYDRLTSLGLAAVIICIFDPYAITNIGFILSFSATLGLIASNYIIENLRMKFSLKTVNVFILFLFECFKMILPCFFAFLFTTPVTICIFNTVSVYSPITNLVLAPLLPFLLGFSLASVLLSLLNIPFITNFLFEIAKAIVSCVLWIAKKISLLPYNNIHLHLDIIVPLIFIISILFIVSIASSKRLRNCIISALLCVPIICSALVLQNITYKDTIHISLIEGNRTTVLIEKDNSLFINGFNANSSYAITQKARTTNKDIVYLLSEGATSKDITDLTSFLNKNKIENYAVPKEFISSFSTIKTSANGYIAEDLTVKLNDITVELKVFGDNTVVTYNIDGFVIANMNIYSAKNLPESFKCDLLIANNLSVPFLERFETKNFILSDRAVNPDFISKNLHNRGINYLGDISCKDLYIKQKRIYKNSK